MHRANSPHKNLVNVPSYVLFETTRQKYLEKLWKWYSEQNNSQLWRVQTVDKDIMSLSTVLNSNLAHTAQVLTIKQQSLAKIISPLVVEVSILLLASQLKFVFNKIAHHIFIYVGHERRGLVFHEYAWFNRIEQIITDKKRQILRSKTALHNIACCAYHEGAQQRDCLTQKKTFSSTFFYCICFTQLNINFLLLILYDTLKIRTIWKRKKF